MSEDVVSVLLMSHVTGEGSFVLFGVLCTSGYFRLKYDSGFFMVGCVVVYFFSWRLWGVVLLYLFAGSLFPLPNLLLCFDVVFGEEVELFFFGYVGRRLRLPQSRSKHNRFSNLKGGCYEGCFFLSGGTRFWIRVGFGLGSLLIGLVFWKGVWVSILGNIL